MLFALINSREVIGVFDNIYKLMDYQQKINAEKGDTYCWMENLDEDDLADIAENRIFF